MKHMALVKCPEDDRLHVWRNGDGTPICGAWIGLTGIRDALIKDAMTIPICQSCSWAIVCLWNRAAEEKQAALLAMKKKP